MVGEFCQQEVREVALRIQHLGYSINVSRQRSECIAYVLRGHCINSFTSEVAFMVQLDYSSGLHEVHTKLWLDAIDGTDQMRDQ